MIFFPPGFQRQWIANSLFALPSLFAFAVLFVVSAAAESIEGIRLEGNTRIEGSTILSQLQSKVGEDYAETKVQEDIKQIYRTGFFEQVIAKRMTKPGNIVLVFQVTEKPAIRTIKIKGNKGVSEETLKEKLNIGTRRFLDRTKIDSGIEQAETYYQEQGYYGTDIQVEITPVSAREVDLTFRIDEGKKKVIREIVFDGNTKVDGQALESVLATGEYNWLTSWITGSGVVKKDQLETDVRELSRYYLNHGFVESRISQPVVEELEDGLRVRYRLTEGDVYNLGKLAANGTLLENNPTKTIDGIESKSGEVFNAELLRKDTFTISEKFTDVGYAFANVEPLTEVNREAKTVDVAFKVDKGQLVHVNRINISGNKKTRDNVIRRTMFIDEQELFSSSKIKRSQSLLQRLGYFEEVTITPDPSPKKDTVDLNVGVREANTGTFSVGAGVASGEGLLLNSQISESNVLGSGNALALDLRTGARNQNYIVSFTNPRVNDTQWSLGTELQSVMRRFDDFDRSQQGGSITTGYPLWFLGKEYLDDIRFATTYEYTDIEINNVNTTASSFVQSQQGRSTSSSITPQLTRNTIDNPIDPTKGSRQNLRTELAGLGGDQQFYLVQAANTWYYPFWKPEFGPFIFSQRSRVGYGDTYNDEPFPLFRRFFPGGINSVRGFRSRGLGPKDDQGNFFGGSKQLVMNFEMIYPLIPSIGINGVVFYDAGNAFDDKESVSFNGLRQAYGWGIRWRSPIAPIRIEFGYPIDREPGDQPVVTNFSFGAPL